MPQRQLSKWLAMAALSAKGKVRERVITRVTEGKCLFGDCENEPVRRGLCTAHYYQFLAGMREQATQAEQVEYEERAIAAGLVLPAGEVRKIKKPNPFMV